MTPDAYLLTDAQCAALGIAADKAAEYAALARTIGPLTPEQRDRLAVLLQPEPGAHADQYRARWPR